MIQNVFAAVVPFLPLAVIIILIITAIGSDNNPYYHSPAFNGQSCDRQ